MLALMSLLVPGLGQAISGKTLRSFVFLAGIVFLLLFGIFAFSSYYLLFIFIIALVVLYIVNIIDAVKIVPEKQSTNTRRLCLIHPVVFIIVLLVFIFSVRRSYLLFRVFDDSMLPLLKKNELIVARKNAYKSNLPLNGELIVYERVEGQTDIHFIHRVIASGKESYEMKNRVIYINDGELRDNRGKWDIEPSSPKSEALKNISENQPRIFLNDSSVFVLGDNRQDSYDSRFIGPIAKKRLKAKALYRVFPPLSL